MKNKKYIKFLIIILLVALLLVIFNDSKSFALSDITEDISDWEPNLEGGSFLADKIGPIVWIIRAIGIIVSVASLSVIGLKIMLGSVEEKASYKQKVVPWILGATMIFAITTIPSIIYDFTQTIYTTKQAQQANVWAEYLAGRDEEIIELKNAGYSADEWMDKLLERMSIYSSGDWRENYKTRAKRNVCYTIYNKLNKSEISKNDVKKLLERTEAIITKIKNGTINVKNINGEIEKIERAIRTIEGKGSNATITIYEFTLLRLKYEKNKMEGIEFNISGTLEK